VKKRIEIFLALGSLLLIPCMIGFGLGAVMAIIEKSLSGNQKNVFGMAFLYGLWFMQFFASFILPKIIKKHEDYKMKKYLSEMEKGKKETNERLACKETPNSKCSSFASKRRCT